jgi:Ca-activated chloride channel family protein
MLSPLAARKRSAPPARARYSIPHSLILGSFFAGLIVAFSARLSLAQDPNEEDVVRVRTDLVTAPAIVTDASGRRQFGLKQEDFVVHVDGQSVKLNHFSTGTDHVALAFLLDASGSARDYVAKQREAALALFSRFGPGSEIAVLRFNEKAEAAVPFTHDIAKARAGFVFPAFAGRHTAIFDSAADAIRLFEQQKNDPAERRIIVLTSDGLDTASRTSATQVIARARLDAISFYVIHFPLFAPLEGHLAMRPTAKGFRELAEKTGGRYFTAGDVKLALDPDAQYDLAAVFKAIEEDLASQYVLGFYPDEASRNGQFHRLDVELTKPRKQKLRVRSLREGYILNKQ